MIDEILCYGNLPQMLSWLLRMVEGRGVALHFNETDSSAKRIVEQNGSQHSQNGCLVDDRLSAFKCFFVPFLKEGFCERVNDFTNVTCWPAEQRTWTQVRLSIGNAATVTAPSSNQLIIFRVVILIRWPIPNEMKCGETVRTVRITLSLMIHIKDIVIGK